jgi:hypothetical protein
MSRNDALGKSITAALRKSLFGNYLELYETRSTTACCLAKRRGLYTRRDTATIAIDLLLGQPKEFASSRLETGVVPSPHTLHRVVKGDDCLFRGCQAT